MEKSSISMVDTINIVPIDLLIPYENQARIHSNEGIDILANSIAAFGFKVPLLVNNDGVIISGHARYEAAKILGMEEVPCIIITDLSPEEEAMFRLVDNKVSDYSGWDNQGLETEQNNLDQDALEEYGFFNLNSTPELERYFYEEAHVDKIKKVEAVSDTKGGVKDGTKTAKDSKKEVDRKKAAAQKASIAEHAAKRGRPLKTIKIKCPCCGQVITINSRFEVVL